MKKVRIIMTTVVFLACFMCFHGRECKASSEVWVSNMNDLANNMNRADDVRIKLAQDITVTSKIYARGVKVFEGNGHNLIRDSRFTNTHMMEVLDGANVVINGLTMTGSNVYADYGMIQVDGSAKLTLDDNVRIWDIHSKDHGAGIANHGTLYTQATFHHCFSDCDGGAIACYSGSHLFVNGGEYKYNKARYGGAIYQHMGSEGTIAGGYFDSNECTKLGQAITAFKTIIRGTPTFSSNNDVYVDHEDNLVMSGYIGDGKVPIYPCSDNVGTKVSYISKDWFPKLELSHRFPNPKNYFFVLKNSIAYLGCNININFVKASGAVSNMDSKQIKWGDKLGTLPVTTRTGYTAGDWYYMQGTNKRYVYENTEIREDSNLALQMDWKPVQVKLEFDGNGGMPGSSSSYEGSKTVTYDSKITGLPGASRSGYTFSGWYTSLTGGTQVKDGDISKFAKDTKLYARWVPITLDVYLYPMGGSVSQSKVTVTYGKQFGKLPVPTRAGYTFAGWSLTQDGKSIVTDTTIVSKAAPFGLYATWKVINYTVTFNTNGGTVSPANKVVHFKEAYGTLPVPKRTGYTFVGWYLDSACKNQVTEKTTVSLEKNHVLYAKWNLNTYTIQFNAQGGTTSTTQMKVAFGSVIGTLPTPVRDGYLFDGWYTQSNGGSKYEASTRMNEAKNITLYARWITDTVKDINVWGISPVYNVNEGIDTRYLNVTVTYSSGKREQITSGYQIDYNNTRAGYSDVVIRYKGKEYRTRSYFYDYWTLRSAMGGTSKIYLYPNEKAKIGISDLPYLRGNVWFESTNSAIATVKSNGKVTAKRAGTVNIKVTFVVNGRKTEIYRKVKVKAPSIKITWKRKKGGMQFKAKTKGCGKITWTCSNKKIGTIGKKNGFFKGKKKGKVYIYASSNGVKKKIKVVVKNGMYECF